MLCCDILLENPEFSKESKVIMQEHTQSWTATLKVNSNYTNKRRGRVKTRDMSTRYD